MSTKPLPPAMPAPCQECPWRQAARRGFLGPHSAQEWAALAHTDTPVACHKTLKGDKGWQSRGVRQCRGMAAYRKNIVKSPRNPDDAANDPATAQFKAEVFKSPAEFLAHHLDIVIPE